jgi:hypothetical protein
MLLTRPVSKIFIHCSASDNPKHDNVQVIREWHLERGFNDIGYHFVITKNGNIELGRDINIIPAAQEGHNTNSIAVCLTGNDRFSDNQFISLKNLCTIFSCIIDKKLTFHGHCEVSNKTCPNFDYKTLLQLDDKGRLAI